MAIDPTRGLPSFTEMYNSFKSKGNLGDIINSGTQGYFNAKNEASKRDLQAAEAEKNRAEAKKANMPKSEGVVRIDQITDPKEKQALAQYATANDQGLLVVPISTYKAVTGRELGQESANLKNQLAQEQAKHNQEIAAKDQKLAEIAQQKADLAAQLSPKVQQTTAAHDLANSAATVEPPTLLGRGASFIKEVVTGKPLASVLAERQGEAARAKLAELSGATVDKAVGIKPTDPETLIDQQLARDGALNTPANREHARKKLGL